MLLSLAAVPAPGTPGGRDRWIWEENHMRKSNLGRTRRTVIAAVATLGLIVAACGGSEVATPAPTPPPPPQTDTGPSDAPPGLAPGEYQIGFIAVTSGGVAFAGVPHLEGLKLAEREINASGYLGEGATIVFVDRDAGGVQEEAVNIANRFIADPDILGLACCALSGVLGALLPLVEEADIAILNHAAITRAVTAIPQGFRAFPLSQPSTKEIAEVAIEAFGVKNAVIAVTADNDGLVSDKDATIEALTAAGAAYTVIDTFQADVDMSGSATQAIAAQPDVIFLAQLGNVEILMVQELRDRGFAGPIIGNLALATQEQWDVAGDTLVGTALPLAFFHESQNPLAQEFTALYEAEYGEFPGIFAAQGWALGWHYARALLEAEEIDRKSILESLAQIETAETVFGRLTWDPVTKEPSVERFTYVQWSDEGRLVLWDGTAAGLLRNVNAS